MRDPAVALARYAPVLVSNDQATTIADLMTPSPHVVDARQDVATAHALMQQYDIRHLPVVKQGALAGLLSHRDVFVAGSVLGKPTGDIDLPVWAVCSRDIYQVDHETPAAVVAEQLANHHLGSALVTREGKLVGIVTTVDIARAYAKLLRHRL